MGISNGDVDKEKCGWYDKETDYPEERDKEKAKECKNFTVQCIDDIQIDVVRDKKTDYAMWKCLEDSYEQKGLSQIS